MSGFGTTPLGLGPCGGLGPTGSLVAVGTRVVAVASSARLLINGDYLLDADGKITGAFDVIDQEAAIRLGIVRGSLVGDPTIGNGIVFIQSFTKTSVVQIAREVELALEPMVTRGDIRNIIVVPTPYVRDGTAVAQYSVSYTKTGRIRI